MRLLGVELRRLDLQFRRPVGTARGSHRHRPVVFVRVSCDGVDGWGECGALPEGTPVDPSLPDVWRALTGGGVERLFHATRARDGSLPPAALVARLYDTTATGRMMAAAMEMAVLDAELRFDGTNLASRLGTSGTAVPAGAVLGIPPDRDPGSLAAAAAELGGRGYRRLRVKIEPGWDVVPVRALRDAVGDLPLQVDANGAYRWDAPAGDPADARRLADLDLFDLACVEQPLPPADLTALAALAGLLATPVCLDESLTSLRRLLDAVRYGACEVACLKPARLGGLFAARQAHDACLAAEVPAFVGGFFDTGLARSAHVALAGLPGFSLAGDLADPADYLDCDPCGYRPPVDGTVVAPEAPGVGPPPDPAVLAARTGAVERFRYRP
jgi:o-succinylbenzoate synthase